MSAPHPLIERLPPLILGGAGGFCYSTYHDPFSVPAEEIVRQAFDLGVRAIDTSPYYEPSEEILGKALAHPRVSERYSRSDYVLMTKVGRIAETHFDYSPAWVRKSVLRSLDRLGTTVLDVVFCHDIEYVTDEETLGAIDVLLEFVRQGQVKYVGLSSYRIDLLAHRARLVRERFGRPLDIIQNWAKLTVQNSLLETEGLQAFRDAGVSCVCTSSPLAIGLLRKGGVPVGQLGDAHPAPAGLREASQRAAEWVEGHGDTLAATALRYTLGRAYKNSTPLFGVRTVTGISSIAEIAENVGAAKRLLGADLKHPKLNELVVQEDEALFESVRAILGCWVDWSFTSPPKQWSQKLKQMVGSDEGMLSKL